MTHHVVSTVIILRTGAEPQATAMEAMCIRNLCPDANDRRCPVRRSASIGTSKPRPRHRPPRSRRGISIGVWTNHWREHAIVEGIVEAGGVAAANWRWAESWAMSWRSGQVTAKSNARGPFPRHAVKKTSAGRCWVCGEEARHLSFCIQPRREASKETLVAEPIVPCGDVAPTATSISVVAPPC